MLTSAGWCFHFYGNLLSLDNIGIIAQSLSFVKGFRKIIFLFCKNPPLCLDIAGTGVFSCPYPLR